MNRQKSAFGICYWFYTVTAFLLAVLGQTLLCGVLLCFVIAPEQNEWLNRQCIQAFLSVSYTHLDVYKRQVTYADLAAHRDAEVIVNTTPVGMYPNNGERLLSLADFPECRGVLDVIYNPLRTPLRCV